MSALQFDEKMSRKIEASYLTPDVVEQRRIIRAALDLMPGEDVLDIGSGPGLLAHEMASDVGVSGTVRGIDPSEAMLALVANRTPAAESAPVEFGPGDATALEFPDESFDAVTSTQVYEYVEDIALALSEAYRVLRSGGRLLVLDTDWDSIVWRSSDPERMRRVLSAWDEHLADPFLPRRLTGLLREAGFTVATRQTIPLFNTEYSERTYSAGLIEFVSSYVPGHQGITADEAAAWADDLRGLGSDYFFSLNRYLFVAVKP